MKQIVFGCFGMLLMFGLLLAQWKIYRYSVQEDWVRQSVRAIERVVERKGDTVEKDELLEMIEMDLAERLAEMEVQFEVVAGEEYFQIHIWGKNIHEKKQEIRNPASFRLPPAAILYIFSQYDSSQCDQYELKFHHPYRGILPS